MGTDVGELGTGGKNSFTQSLLAHDVADPRCVAIDDEPMRHCGHFVTLC